MFQDLLDAINRLDNALNNSAAQQAGQDIGEALGGLAVYSLKKTPEEISGMDWAQITTWRNAIAANPPEGCPPIASPLTPPT